MSGTVALAIVLLFVHHPSIHAHHTGYAGWLVGLVFIAATVAGSVLPPRYSVGLIVGLAFIEPGILVTRTLAFDVLANGLVIGAVIRSTEKAFIPRQNNLMIIGAILLLAAALVIVPALKGDRGWINIHDTVKFIKYALVLALAMRVSAQETGIHIVAWSVVIGSSVAALFTLIFSLHVGDINQWILTTYMADHRIPAGDIERLATTYPRAYGVTGPIDNAAQLSLGLGGWFVLWVKGQGRDWDWAPVVGIVMICLAIFLTGTRTGMIAAALALIVGLVMWHRSSVRGLNYRSVAAPAVCTLAIFLIVAGANSSFGRTAQIATMRVTQTIPRLASGNPDPSVGARLPQYFNFGPAPLGMPKNPGEARNGDFLRISDHLGFFGLFAVWGLWMLLAIRSTRAATLGASESVQIAGIAATATVTAALAVAIGAKALASPAIMTVVLVLVGSTPMIHMVVDRSRSGAVGATPPNEL